MSLRLDEPDRYCRLCGAKLNPFGGCPVNWRHTDEPDAVDEDEELDDG